MKIWEKLKKRSKLSKIVKIYVIKLNLLDLYYLMFWIKMLKFPQLWKLWSHYIRSIKNDTWPTLGAFLDWAVISYLKFCKAEQLFLLLFLQQTLKVINYYLLLNSTHNWQDKECDLREARPCAKENSAPSAFLLSVVTSSKVWQREMRLIFVILFFG